MNLISSLKTIKVILFVFVLTLSSKCFSQEATKETVLKRTDVMGFKEVDTKPEFPGGIERFYKFVGNNFRMVDPRSSGKVVAKFIIETDGSLSNFEITLNEVGVASGEELIRVLRKCPKWISGSQNGKAVAVFYSVPITLQSGM